MDAGVDLQGVVDGLFLHQPLEIGQVGQLGDCYPFGLVDFHAPENDFFDLVR